MNALTHRTIYSHARGCLMAVAETAKSSSKASGSVRSRRASKPKTSTCRKARSALPVGNAWLQVNMGKGYAPSQLGTGPFASWLVFSGIPLAFGVRPPLFAASLNTVTTQLRYGNLSVAAKAVTIDMSANQSISALATQPGMGWITQLQDDPALKGKIDWNKIDEAHKNWSYSQQGLSPAGAALLSIALAYATGGGASLNFIGGGAIGNAGFLTLANQASLAFANNGGNLGHALQSLGESGNVKALVTSMLTAGTALVSNAMQTSTK